MARLAQSKTTVAQALVAQELTVNKEGAEAYKLTERQRLIEAVLGSFWNEDLFYQKGQYTTKQIISDIAAVGKVEPKFILQLAAYARNYLYMRTAPQVLLVEAAHIEGCKPYIREYTPKIVKRADELSEVVSYQLQKHGKAKFPNSLKKGLADAFKNFDEYQLNKYDSDKRDVSLGDVAKLVHPQLGKAMYNYLTKDEVDADALPKLGALKALLAKDKLDEEALELVGKSNVTWETLISKFGSSKETWSLVAPNMGYMALLRNLRNFEEKGVDLDPILERIKNPEAVRKSKQLPFRFYSADKEVSGQKTHRAIAQAFEASISNVQLSGKTAVFIDLSGSMTSALSAKSKVSYKEVASVLGAIAVKKSDESCVVGFAETAKLINVNPDDTMITNIFKIVGTNIGYSTNAWLAFQEIGNRDFDRIILISDMQCYGGSVSDQWKQYQKNHPNAYLYSMDVSAYGTKQTPSKAKNVVLLNGWSDKIIDYMNLVEKRDIMEAEIRKW